MENVKNETQYQIIIDLYQNHKAKGKPYAVAHFAKMKVGKSQVHRAIARYESSKSYQHQKGSGCPLPKEGDTKGGSRHQEDGK